MGRFAFLQICNILGKMEYDLMLDKVDMKRNYSDLSQEEQNVLNAELSLLGRGRLSNYLLERDSSFTDKRFCTEAGWTEIRQNRAMIVQELATRLFMSKMKVAEILFRIEKQFERQEPSANYLIIESKIKPKKKMQFISETTAQGKQQMVVLPNGDVFESIKAAAQSRKVSPQTMARHLRNDTI